MSARRNAPRRIRIDRVDLDLRGIAPATAEAAARALGPALERELASRAGEIGASQRVDAGRLSVTASQDPVTLAQGIAQRIAAAARRPRS